jgi:hypothetical protein
MRCPLGHLRSITEKGRHDGCLRTYAPQVYSPFLEDTIMADIFIFIIPLPEPRELLQPQIQAQMPRDSVKGCESLASLVL